MFNLKDFLFSFTGSCHELTKVSSVTVLVLSFVLCFSTLFHFVSLLPLINIEHQPPREPFCVFYHRFTTIMAGISFSCACFALWFRVYAIFYRHPIVRASIGRKVRFLSKSAVVYFFLMASVNLAAFLSAPPYETVSIGCRRRRSGSHSAIKWGLLVTSLVLFQATLFFLLVYPLVRHRKKTINLGNESTKVMPIIKRAFFTALVCVLSNTFTGLFGIVSKETFTYMRHLVYGANFIITLFALICFSVDWKERLFPCYLNYVLEKYPHRQTRITGRNRSLNNVNSISCSPKINPNVTSNTRWLNSAVTLSSIRNS